MAERREFSLGIWEGTEDFKREYERAKAKFDDIGNKLHKRGFRCGYLGGLRMNGDGEPEVWLNDSTSLRARRQCKGWEDAKRIALEHGRSGYWNLKELEQFAIEGGPILADAMWNLGYRRAKKDRAKWARIAKGDRAPQRVQEQIEEIEGEELERLNRLWVLPNQSAGLDRTYEIGAGARGLIFINLLYNPFYGGPAEGLDSYYGPRMSNRGHVAKQQNGFQIEAKDVRLGEQQGVYIKAIRPDASYAECVWPIQTPTERIYDLADDLVARVKCADAARA